MKYILNSSFLAKKLEGSKYLIGTTLLKQYEVELDEPSKKIFELFSQDNTIESVINEMDGILDRDDVIEIINFAIKETIIVPSFKELIDGKEEYSELYDRQIRLFEEVSPGFGIHSQKKLINSRVVLLGVGGTGSYTLYTLAAMGVGFVRAIDFDEVQLSNLSRQILYNRADVGKLKIDCAKERINQLNPDLKYEYINKKVESESDIEELIKDCDFLIVSADTPRKKIKMMAHNACVKCNVPYVSGGSCVDSIGVGPLFIPHESKGKYYSYFDDKTYDIEDNFTESFNKSFVSTLIDPYNALAASYAALECIKYITGFSEPTLKDKVMIINLQNYETTIAEI